MKQKIKCILSLFTLAGFAILGGGSISSEEITIYLICIAVVVVIGILISINMESKAKVEREQRALRLKERQEKARMQYEQEKSNFISEYGTPDKTIQTKELDFGSEIHCFETRQEIFILGNKYNFKDVLSCTFSDSPQTIKGQITAVTKSSTGSVIGRSIVGDVVAGPAGAIIGGVTAKKNTEYKQGNDRVVHDYTVIINMNSIANPIIRIYTGKDGKLTNEIVGLMNVIITRK